MEPNAPREESEAELYEQAPCGYLSTRPDGRIVKVNETFLSWLGLEQADLVGKKRFQELLTIPGRVFYESHFHPILLAESRIDAIAFEIKLRPGQTLPILVTGILKRDAGGAPAIVRLMVFNATERRAYEQALLQKTKELDRLNTRKNELLGMVAHDLRTPLGAISAYSNLLASELGPTLSPSHRELVDTIIDLSAFMSGLVTDILDVASIESGRLKLDRRPQPIAPVLRRAAHLHAVLARKKRITIETRAGEGDVSCDIDARKIDQVLNNLLGNAIKFSHEGTKIEVALEVTSADVTISVRDQGQGIPAAELDRIFTPFTTGSVRGTAGEPSTGLGLAIAQSIVVGHGGKIRVTSAVGEGSTFSFTLPRSAPVGSGIRDVPPARPAPAVPSVRPRTVRILVAEDNPVNQKIASLMLAKLGAEAILARTGREAVSLFERTEVDLVLMDCHMPEMDGHAAAAAIRALEATSPGRGRVPILAMTAGAEDDRARCLASGMDDFLQKPATPDQLAEALQRWARA